MNGTNSTLTVGSLKTALGYGTPNSIFPDDEFMNLLNQCLEQFSYSGKWKGALLKYTFAASLGEITLPFDMLSVMGGNHGDFTFGGWGCGGSMPVFAESHEFIEGGPGHIDETQCFRGILLDDQDGHPSLIEMPTGLTGNFKIVIQTPSDTSKVLRFNASDQNGQPIYDNTGLGFNTSGLTYPTTIVPTLVTSLEGIQIPAMVQPWTLYFTSGGTDYLLGTYYPPQRSGCYRRYKTGTTDKPIRVLCQRRFIPVAADTDWCYPGHVLAIKLGMKAVQKEDATVDAESDWARAYEKLNEQVHALRGGNRLEIPPATFDYQNGFSNLM